MATKEDFCFRIFKSYSLIVGYTGEPSTVNVPGPIEGKETFKQWKKRVLGDKAKDVFLYLPVNPKPQKLISSLQEESEAENLAEMFRIFEKKKNDEIEEIVDKKVKRKVKKAVKEAVKEAEEKAEEKTEERLKSITIDTLEDLIYMYKDNFDPSVDEFFDTYLKSNQKTIQIEELLHRLIPAYNSAVKKSRRLQDKLPLNAEFDNEAATPSTTI